MSTVGSSEVLVDDRDDGVRLVTLNRPDRLNSLNPEIVETLVKVLTDAERSASVRVIVLTGAGRGFCSGWDVKDAGEVLSGDTIPGGLDMQRDTATLIRRLRASTVPVIAAANGAAAGGGFSLALACDMRVMARSAELSAMFIRLGISGGDLGTSWLLPRVIGLARTMELLLTGAPINAAEADRIGLVNRVVDDERVVESAMELAGQIAQHAPFAIGITKETVWANTEIPSLYAGMELENRTQILATQTKDHQEALAAWREKRAPRFQNR